MMPSSKNIEADLALLHELKKVGVLGTVSKERLPAQAGERSLMVCCADSDQFGDVFSKHITYCGCNRCAPLNHFGGALVIPRHSPAAALGQSDLVMSQLFLGYALGKGDVQFHLSHWPCGIARGYKLSAATCLSLLCDSKDETLGYFHHTLECMHSYLEVVKNDDPSEARIGKICMEARLTRKQVLELQRIHMCSSADSMRRIKMPRCTDIVSHFHIDWPVKGHDKKKRTYHVDRTAFREWVSSSSAKGLIT